MSENELMGDEEEFDVVVFNLLVREIELWLKEHEKAKVFKMDVRSLETMQKVRDLLNARYGLIVVENAELEEFCEDGVFCEYMKKQLDK